MIFNDNNNKTNIRWLIGWYGLVIIIIILEYNASIHLTLSIILLMEIKTNKP